jgi:hypothetical protein
MDDDTPWIYIKDYGTSRHLGSNRKEKRLTRFSTRPESMGKTGGNRRQLHLQFYRIISGCSLIRTGNDCGVFQYYRDIQKE